MKLPNNFKHFLSNANVFETVGNYARGPPLVGKIHNFGAHVFWERDRETETQRDRETKRQRDRETKIQRDKETERQRDRETQ